MSSDTPPIKTDAIEVLSALLDMDPLYCPAQFMLAYAHLSRGNAAAAAHLFGKVLDTIEDRSRRTADRFVAESKIVSPLFHWPSIGKRLPFVRVWVDYYAAAHLLLTDGWLMDAARTWSELKRDLEPLPDETEWAKHIRNLRIGSRVASLRKTIGDLPEVAAGMTGTNTSEQAAARRDIDRLLDEHEVLTFDVHLIGLGVRLTSHATRIEVSNMAPYPECDAEERKLLEDVNTLSRRPVSPLLQEQLTTLLDLVKQKRWPEAAKQTDVLRGATQRGSPDEFLARLRSVDVGTWRAWVATWFVPALATARRHHAELWPPLLDESKYHEAQSLLMTLDPHQIKLALDRLAQFVFTQRALERAPELSSGGRDFNILVLCLCIEAVARWEVSSRGSENPWRRALEIGASQAIKATAQLHTRNTQVQAAVSVALGLIERLERPKETDWQPPESMEQFRKRRTDSLERECEYLERAIDLRATATTHCYLAECLIERGRSQDAALHIQRALQLSPEHLLARQLRQKATASIP